MSGQTLFRKYMLIFVVLVSGALLTSGALEIFFSYQENQAALVAVQREKALGAAARIEAFVQEVERLVAGALPTAASGTPVSVEQRRIDFARLLRQAPAISEVSYLDPSGASRCSTRA
jgi:two-component system NtrC family sensor kinase